LLALAFLYCQAWILRAAKGIPIWREPSIVMLIVATGLAEGFGLLGVAAGLVGMSAAVALPLSALMLLAVAVRFAAWRSFREALGRKGAPTRALAALDELQGPFEVGAHLLPACLLVAGHLVPVLAATTLAFAGLLVVAGGWMLKHRIVTRAAFNPGFAVTRMPARGAGTGAPGVRPGWTAATTSAAG
jgi:phenylacetyl-CoA:acceptor oxidoreductase subunit 2